MKRCLAIVFLILLVSCNRKTVAVSDAGMDNHETILSISEDDAATKPESGKLERREKIPLIDPSERYKDLPPIEGYNLGPGEPYYLIFYNDHIYVVDIDSQEYAILPENSYFLGEDGYYRVVIDKQLKRNYSGETIMINGKYVWHSFDNAYFSSLEKEYNNYDEYDVYEHLTRHIKNLSSSKYLKETINGKLLEYRAENLYNSFLRDCSCHGASVNIYSIPWVEGENDAGIGSYIEIEYESPVDVLSILNGFVDCQRLNLFRENNRPKVLTISDLENDKEYIIHVQDYVYFSDVAFEPETSKIRITISDVYPGTKYNDTCISALIEGDDDKKRRNPWKIYLYDILFTALDKFEEIKIN